MKELVIQAEIKNLDAVLDFVTTELEKADCPTKLQTQISITVEEIFVNLAHYAYTPAIGEAVIRIAADKEAVIEFEDQGKPYNPLEKEDPDITAGATEREAGGLGIFIVKKIMDSAEYRHTENKNILVLRKTIKPNHK